MNRQMKISTRLLVGFGLVAAMALAVLAWMALEQRRLAEQLTEIADDRMAKIDKFSAVKDNLNVGARAIRNALLAREPDVAKSERDRVIEVRRRNAELLAELDKTLVLPQARAQFAEIQRLRAPFNEQVDRVLELSSQGQAEEANRLLTTRVREHQAALFKAVDESIDTQQAAATALAHDAASRTERNVLVLVLSAACMLVAAGAVSWWTVRSLTRTLGAEPDELAAAARRVAEGDLGPVPGADRAEARSVLAALGTMQESLAGIVGQVRGASDGIATGSTQIANGNTDLSQRTEEQASALQQTAATMEQLGVTVRNNTESAKQASQLAQGAAAVATRGGEVVDQVVTTMRGISDSSRRIGDIIGVIDGIAFQTNILALNAAVEAARAGEQGRGFAVVAGEVRTLAQRSAEAAKEIKTLIGQSVEQVEKGTLLADQAGQTMEEIVGSSRRVSDIVGEITAAALEQSGGVQQVGEAVGQMDQMTQQNAALVEQSAAAAQSLRQQADQLVQLVAAFKLTGHAAAASRPGVPTSGSAQAPAPAALLTGVPREAAPAPTKTASVRPAAASASKPAPVGGTPGPKQQSAQDEWATF